MVVFVGDLPLLVLVKTCIGGCDAASVILSVANPIALGLQGRSGLIIFISFRYFIRFIISELRRRWILLSEEVGVEVRLQLLIQESTFNQTKV